MQVAALLAANPDAVRHRNCLVLSLPSQPRHRLCRVSSLPPRPRHRLCLVSSLPPRPRHRLCLVSPLPPRLSRHRLCRVSPHGTILSINGPNHLGLWFIACCRSPRRTRPGGRPGSSGPSKGFDTAMDMMGMMLVLTFHCRSPPFSLSSLVVSLPCVDLSLLFAAFSRISLPSHLSTHGLSGRGGGAGAGQAGGGRRRGGRGGRAGAGACGAHPCAAAGLNKVFLFLFLNKTKDKARGGICSHTAAMLHTMCGHIWSTATGARCRCRCPTNQHVFDGLEQVGRCQSSVASIFTMPFLIVCHAHFSTLATYRSLAH